jgi:hypothetical protein
MKHAAGEDEQSGGRMIEQRVPCPRVARIHGVHQDLKMNVLGRLERLGHGSMLPPIRRLRHALPGLLRGSRVRHRPKRFGLLSGEGGRDA